jgi:acetyltransferase-like isoleucine patch superfamily enzyme
MTWRRPIILDGELTEWKWLVRYPEKLTLGVNTDIGAFTLILAHNGVEIQEGVQIGSHCAILSKSTIDKKDGKVTIKKGARVGVHSTVMPGVTIGEGALVAAHSFVNKDVPDGAFVGGVPAKPIQMKEDREDLMWSSP